MGARSEDAFAEQLLEIVIILLLAGQAQQNQQSVNLAE
jgi:hypothetical protein